MKQIQPMEPQRDREGYWTHPGMPAIETSAQFDAWQAEQGFECSVVMLDGDDGIGAQDAGERYAEGDTDILAWQPSKPEGEGWFIVSIHDTEDGPACVWVRPKVEMVENNLDELKQAFIDSHKVCERAAYDYFAALPVGDDRTNMGEIYQRIRLATSKSGKGA